jgi:hypothetical protein
MDITNATGQDTKYNVSGGGGSPMDPHHPHREFRMEETASWPVVHAGSRISCNVKSDGPWAVYFFVQGKSYCATAKSAGSHLTLLQNGGGFTVQVD